MRLLGGPNYEAPAVKLTEVIARVVGYPKLPVAGDRLARQVAEGGRGARCVGFQDVIGVAPAPVVEYDLGARRRAENDPEVAYPAVGDIDCQLHRLDIAGLRR